MLLEYSTILVLWLVITLLDWAVKGVVYDILDIFFSFLFFLLEFKFLEEGNLKKYLLLEIWKARCGVTYKNIPHNLWTWDGDSHSVHAGGQLCRQPWKQCRTTIFDDIDGQERLKSLRGLFCTCDMFMIFVCSKDEGLSRDWWRRQWFFAGVRRSMFSRWCKDEGTVRG